MNQRKLGQWPVVAVAFWASMGAGCVSWGKYDRMRNRHDSARAQAVEQTEAAQQCQAGRTADREQLANAEAERDALQGKLARSSNTISRLQTEQAAARATSDQLHKRIDELEARLRARAAVFRLRPADLRAGRVFGLRPGGVVAGTLKPYLERNADEPELLELGLDAAVTVDKHRADWLAVTLERKRVAVVEIGFNGSGDDQVRAIRDLVGRLCKKTRNFHWRHHRPGPGTPKVDQDFGVPMPLVRTSTARCTLATRPWTVAVRADWRQDSASLNNISARLVYETAASP